MVVRRHQRIGIFRHKRTWLSVVLIACAAVGASTLSARAGTSLVTGSAQLAINSAASPGIIDNDPCSSSTYGSVIIAGAAWAGGMAVPQSAGGANFDVHSNWDGSSCWRSPTAADGRDAWGIQYQCTELAMRAADLEWNEGGTSSWVAAGWSGNGSNMFDVAGKLPTPLVAVPNGSGSLPNPGDIMVWGPTPSDTTGHVAVVERVDTAAQRVWIVSQNSMFAEYGLPYSGTTIDPTNNFGLPLRGWLDDPRPTRGVALRSDGKSGYTLDGWGGVVPFGGAPPLAVTSYWPQWDITRGIAMLPDDTGGYVLDAYGGLHPFGAATSVNVSVYWPGWDIARGVVVRADGKSGYVLDGWGGLHPFGNAPSVTVSGYWPYWDIARAVMLRPDGVSGYVLDAYGALHPFGGAPNVSITAYWGGWDIARAAFLVNDGSNPSVPANSGWVLDGYGGLHPFGGAPAANFAQYPYFPGHDVARGVAYQSLTDTGVTVTGPSAPGVFHVAPPARAVAYRPGTTGGYVLDGWGGLTAFGGAAALPANPSAYWPEWDIARGLALRSDGSGYVLDGYGGVHAFGNAPAVSISGYWPGQDLARGIVLRADGMSGYVLDEYGALWQFGGAPALKTTKTWTFDMARALVLQSTGTGGCVLDAYGGIHPFGSATTTQAVQWPNWDIARSIALVTDTSGYVLDGWGGIHEFGGAQPVTNEAYFQGLDIARGLALAPQTGSVASGVVAFVDGDVRPFSSS